MVYGIVAVVIGSIVDIVFYVRTERHSGFGPTVALVTGILGVMSGVMLLAYPTAGRVGVYAGFSHVVHCTVSPVCHIWMPYV